MASSVQIIFEIDRDRSGRTTLRQIEGDINRLGSASQRMGRDVDVAMGVFKGTLVAEFFRRGLSEARSFADGAITEFNRFKGAQLGLTSVAIFRNISADRANEAVQGLALVRRGLLTTAEASEALKNFLSTGFGLDESITLINRFGDSAAFNRQAALTFGQAVVSASEGIRNQNSLLVDNAGITKNISVILKERGFEIQDLYDKVKGASAREALYKGLLAETAAQVGNADKMYGTFAGALSLVDAAKKRLLITIGELIATNPDLQNGLKNLIGGIESLIVELNTAGSPLRRQLEDFVSMAGQAISTGGEFLDFLREYANVLGFIAKTSLVVAGANLFTKGVGTGLSGLDKLAGYAQTGAGLRRR